MHINLRKKLSSKPHYRYATGTIKVRFIKPTPNKEVKLRAVVKSYTPKKVFIKCYVESNNVVTAKAEVVAFRVFDAAIHQKIYLVVKLDVYKIAFSIILTNLESL